MNNRGTPTSFSSTALGESVVLQNGFKVENGRSITVDIDPLLLP